MQNYFRDGDLGSADKVYVFSKDGKTEGASLVKYEEGEGTGKVLNLLLTTVENSSRDAGINKEMLDVLLSEERDVLGVMGVTHTPAAVINRMKVGARHGLTTYFGGRKNGDSNEALTDQERERLKAMMKLVDGNIKEYGFEGLQEGVPPFHVSYGESSIPPRIEEELLFSDTESPLKKTFREMIRWQQEHKPEETVYGTLFSLR
ncbi:hypothetical protein COY07_00740 [Candidatus Peregrinibacteria bacterium CG_4_10_14_0_2_um_filter_43_11]|nr:MAG: hypothetical protein COY07_00740 [Candidatus Peregrinibacteria bacterium CG_4_10_14_0_2_um_filter_43_11]